MCLVVFSLVSPLLSLVLGSPPLEHIMAKRILCVNQGYFDPFVTDENPIRFTFLFRLSSVNAFLNGILVALC